MRNPRWIVASVVMLAMAPAAPLLAQTERTGNADARVMQQLQQVTGERAALQSENAKLKQEIEGLKKDLARVSASNSALQGRSKALEAAAGRGEQSGKQAEEQLERARAQMQELVTKFRETAQTLRDVEGDRTALRGQFEAREREFKTCVDRNAGLYNLNAEVLDKMANRGFWSNLTEREPFTRLKRVELENLIDDYKYRADELRLEQQKRVSASP